MENSRPPYVLIIKRVYLKGSLYLTFTLCDNLFLTRERFPLLANEPAASSVLTVARGL